MRRRRLKMHPLAELDHRFIWHPFTQMREWLKREPIVIASGKGAMVRDARSREYLDANSSIWTNLHGHNHPRINAAIQRQLKKIAHSSALGFANEPASLLAEKLVNAANPQAGGRSVSPRLGKVFYSDDGSTAMEVALKLAYEFSRRSGRKNPKFLSLGGAYHGDTVGAVSLGHIDLFHKAYGGLLFKSDQVAAPYCYRCPFNRAKPERADAREYRKCHWECVGEVERKFAKQKKRGNPYAGFVFEPLMQGAAGMIAQPEGWLRRTTGIARAYGALLIADEVMTGFGRAGQPAWPPTSSKKDNHEHPYGTWPSPIQCEREKLFQRRDEMGRKKLSWEPPAMFACHTEGVQPDFLALAKGLTGGYLPMAATLTTQKVFDAFLGNYEEFKTFFHGHSYTGNQLGASAALASLEILQSEQCMAARRELSDALRRELKTLWKLPNVGDIRKTGLVAGIELVRNWRTREPFEPRERAGIRVCEAMAERGVLTRPIGNVIVLMPPYCTSPTQVRRAVKAVYESCDEIFG